MRTASLIRPADDLQYRTGILNHGMTVTAVKPVGKSQNLVLRVYNNLRHELSPSRSNRTLWRTIRNAAIWMNEKAEPWLSAILVRLKLRELCLIVRAEQSPNPESRVTLSPTRKDIYGMPRIELDWQFQDIDKQSVKIMLENFDGFLRKHSLGKVDAAPWLDDPSKQWDIDPLISTHAIGGYHHMGTTRMADSPETGVVDENGKVFGICNLYVAGSSVFPTCGWANPTLTIVALSQRLAEHVSTLHQENMVQESEVSLKFGA